MVQLNLVSRSFLRGQVDSFKPVGSYLALNAFQNHHYLHVEHLLN